MWRWRLLFKSDSSSVPDSLRTCSHELQSSIRVSCYALPLVGGGLAVPMLGYWARPLPSVACVVVVVVVVAVVGRMLTLLLWK